MFKIPGFRKIVFHRAHRVLAPGIMLRVRVPMVVLCSGIETRRQHELSAFRRVLVNGNGVVDGVYENHFHVLFVSG